MLNLPNLLSIFRILLVPPLVVVLLTKFEDKEWWGLGLFLLAAVMDFFDGWFARRRKQVTRLGTLLDPAADKILISAAFISLVEMDHTSGHTVVPAWIVVVIIAREFLISGLRSVASAEGFTIQASDLGKLKTVVQIVSVVSAILAHGWYQWQFGVLVIPVQWIAIAAIYFTVLVSSISAVDYFVAFWKQIDGASKNRRQGFILSRQKGVSTTR